MEIDISVGQSVAVRADPGITATQLSTAKLTGVQFSSDNPAVFTVVPDPNNAQGCILTAVGAGTANLTVSGHATETSGVSEDLTVTASVVVTAVVVNPPVATTLILTVGTAVSTGNPVPPVPPPAPASPSAVKVS